VAGKYEVDARGTEIGRVRVVTDGDDVRPRTVSGQVGILDKGGLLTSQDDGGLRFGYN
jgi:hypothetical protein